MFSFSLSYLSFFVFIIYLCINFWLVVNGFRFLVSCWYWFGICISLIIFYWWIFWIIIWSLAGLIFNDWYKLGIIMSKRVTFINYLIFLFLILFFFLNFCLGTIFRFNLDFWFRICFCAKHRIYILILIYFDICIRISFIYLFCFSANNWFYRLRTRLNRIIKLWFGIIIFLIFFIINKLCFNICNLFIVL